ncbi:MAG: M28 family peptidase [Ignavibacteriales bacterium]|nr:M28 family peptidase [Ignavibacteriales bacterium]
MNRKIAWGFVVLLGILIYAFNISTVLAQKKKTFPEDSFSQSEMTAHLRFLASDELMGRMTGEQGNDVAARYIAEQFRAAGVVTVPGADGYFQHVPFVRRIPSTKGRLLLSGDTLKQGKEMVLWQGKAINVAAPVVVVGQGIVDTSKGIDDYKGLDVKGKIVAAKFSGFNTIESKRKAAIEHGAAAMIDLYSGSMPWKNILGFFSQPNMSIQETGSNSSSSFPHVMIRDSGGKYAAALGKQSSTQASLSLDEISETSVTSRNVVGLIKGSDPKSNNEYVILMAHYDHVGAGLKSGATKADTIFNGARDNAIGAVSLVAAAKAFSGAPPARSVLLLAVTAEEIGELGSNYYVAHPLIPLNRTVFVLNSDGAGFDDTTAVTVVGLERTTAESAIKSGSLRYGLTAIPDPVPEQQLFDRSDNTQFARKGVPAPTYSAGFRSFGPEIQKYYHRPADEAGDDFNFSYALKFYKAFVHSARQIAAMPQRLFWKSGDKYETAGKALYGK